MIKPNILRGEVLESLYKLYPDGASDDSLHSIFFQYNKYEAVTNAINYLLDKKLIKKIEEPDLFAAGAVFVRYKITPEGIDLIEGSIKSIPGILIPRRG